MFKKLKKPFPQLKSI